MKNSTRAKFTAMAAALASSYGVTDVSKSFAATPSIEQTLMDKITHSVDFLSKINVLGVTEKSGGKILGSVSALIGKRTDTANDNKRVTTSVMNLDNNAYACEKTEYDVNITYEQLDAWAKFPDFEQRFLKYVRRAIALGRIKVGFHGTSIANPTVPGSNPNGEDVNKGWIEHLRTASQIITQGDTANEIRLGTGGDYPNLDAMVFDTLQMVDEIHRDRDDLVTLLGRDLLHIDKSQLYTAQGQTPTEKERVETASVTRTYGGLPSMTVPHFPARGLMITPLANLSIYFQEQSVRQKINDNSELDRVDHFNTINDAYVVEDTDAAATIEFANVKLPGEWV